MWKLALCLCFLAQHVHGQIEGYTPVAIFSCDDSAQDNVPQLIIKTEKSGNVSSPCYDGNRTDYTMELDAGLRLVNITFDSSYLHGYRLTIEDFQIAESDRLYIGPNIVDAGRNSQGVRDFILTSDSTTSNDINIQRAEDGPVTDTLNSKDTTNNTLLFNVSNGYSSVFLDFYTVVNTVAGRGFLIKFEADINQCLFVNDVWCMNGGTCTRTGFNAADCACTKYWEGDRCEIDVNECTLGTHDCDTNADCGNIEGGFNCTCENFWEGNGTTCTDINECATDDLNDCDETGTCDNKERGYSCICNSGYTGGDDGRCININECNFPNDCDNETRANCLDGIGNYTCACKAGYTGDGKNCADIDECLPGGANNCSESAICTNDEPGFSCVCKDGFTGNGVDCNDINECDSGGANNCSKNADCTNDEPGFSCVCKDGFTGDGVDCNDENECENGDDDCAINSTCTNFAGGFNCSCHVGFTGDGTVCSNINECSTTGTCHKDADCVDNTGSFTCSCKNGFSGDGFTCIDIDECLPDGGNNCNESAICTNNEPGFKCDCKDGFSGDGVNCEDDNECDSTNECKPDSTCTNIQGNYTCPCNDGYEGNGFVSCTNIVECNTTLDTCERPESTCSDVPGSFNCICNEPVYRGLDNSDCDYYCDHDTNCLLTYTTGFLEMPRVYDGNTRYDTFRETFWNFTGTAKGIRFVFKAFNTEIKDDFLSVYPGNTIDFAREIVGISGIIGQLYNEKTRVLTSGDIPNESGVAANLNISTSEPVLTISSSNILFVFTSDRRNASTGFRIAWEFDSEDCNPNITCANGGTCEDRVFSYQCVGCDGYEGADCDLDIDECATETDRCDGNATCNNTIGNHTCECNEDFIGDGINCREHIVIDGLNVTSTATTLNIAFSVTSRWSAPEYIEKFKVTLTSLPDGLFTRTFIFNSTDLIGSSFTFGGLNSFTKYTLTIEVNATGSLFGTVRLDNKLLTQVITTEELEAATPVNFRLSSTQRDRITLNWEKPVEFGNGTSSGFGEVLHYEICSAPSTTATVIAILRGESLANNCLIVDDTYLEITLTKLIQYMNLSFKIRAYSRKGYSNYTTVKTSFTGTFCPAWVDEKREDCDGLDDLLLQSDGFPRAITSSDNEVIVQYWSFDHAATSAWRINVFYFDVQDAESALDFGFGDINILDHDVEKANREETLTGEVSAGSRPPVTRDTTDASQEIVWFAFISDRTRKRPGFQVEIEPDGDSCVSTPCLHGGVCTDGTFSYTCDCSATDWNGTNCEDPHIKPSASCTTRKTSVSVTFEVQDEWKNDETVIGGYTISINNTDSDSVGKMIDDNTTEFTSLEPYTVYTVTVAVVQPNAVSRRNNTVRETETIDCRTLQDVPTVPRNVVVTPKSSGFDVKWDAPAKPNGVVRYTVTYSSVDHATYGEAATSTKSSFQSSTTFSVNTLRDYRMYAIIVEAYTGAGSIEADNVTERTSPGAPYAFNSTATDVTVIPNRAARVEWAFAQTTPFVGPITVTVTAVSLVATSSNTSEPNGNILIVGGLEEGQMYNFTLTASTGTAPDQVETVTGINTASIAPGLVASFSYNRETNTLSWTPPAPVDRNGEITAYLLTAVSTVPGFTSQRFGAGDTSFGLPNLPAFTKYTFTLQAVNGEGNGIEFELEITTKEEVPAVPANIKQGQVNSTHITLSWEGNNPPVGNTVYTVTYSDGTESKSFETSATTATITSLSPYTTYTITIIATTNAGSSAATAEQSIQTAEGAPSVVQNLDANYSGGPTYQIAVTWDEPAELNGVLQGYSVSWNIDGGVGGGPTPVAAGATSLSILEVIQSEATFEITVYATTGGGDGPKATLSIQTPVIRPEVPENVVVLSGSTTATVTIATPDPITPTGYIIIIEQNNTNCIAFGDDSCRNNDTITVTALPYTITGLKSYRNYFISVIAVRDGVQSGPTPDVYFDTLPGAPNEVTVITSTTQSGVVDVTFVPGTPFTGPASYTVTLTDPAGNTFTETVPETDVRTAISVSITGVAANTQYIVSVTSTVNGESANSPENSEQDVTTVPATPVFTITPTGANQIEVSVTAVNGATSYVINYEEANCTVNCTSGTVTSNGTSAVTIDGLDPYTVYAISVSAVSAAGGSSATTESNRTNAGTPSLINPATKINVATTVDTDIRSAYNVVLDNLCETRSSVFDETEGVIISIRYIVIQDGTTELFSDDRVYGEVHAQEPSPPFTAIIVDCLTTSRRRRKRKTTSDNNVVIGARSDCPGGGTDVCNGPLKPSTTYTFRACGENEAGRRACTAASDPVTTGEAPESTLTAGEIAAIVICSILLLILIILLIVYLVRRRKAKRGKHTVSRVGRENPTFDSTKSQQQQKYQVDPAAEPQTKYTTDPVA